MKNLIEAFFHFSLKKDTDKNLNKKKSSVQVNSVHRRRDLDSLGEFINF